MTFKKAILATLFYHDAFDYPMTQQEIFKFLVVNSKFKIQNSLRELEIKKKIDNKNGYFFLAKREKTVELREKRKKYSREKIKITKKIAKILSKIPFVRMIAVTGALAMENSDKNDDIDLLIITCKNRLWLTRLITVVILEILGKRRRPNDRQFKDKVCLNMFLDKTCLKLSKKKQNLFTAHEIVQIKPLYNKDQTYEKFLEANRWVKKYLPNGIKRPKDTSEVDVVRPLAERTSGVEGKRKKLLHCFIAPLLHCSENIAYQLQLKFMESKKTTEDVSSHFAFFHPRNTGKEVLKKYKKKIAALD